MGYAAEGFLLFVVLFTFLSSQRGVLAVRFVIDREECFSHEVKNDYDVIHVSFVVIKSDSWRYNNEGVDIVIKGPNGEQFYDARDKISEKYEFMAHDKGVYKFCFTNKSPYHETLDFDVYISQFSHFDQHAKDEHIKPLTEQISKLDNSLKDIRFEQHWLIAETEREAIINERMSKRAIHKAALESVALVSVSAGQIYLVRRLFNKKLGVSRV